MHRNERIDVLVLHCSHIGCMLEPTRHIRRGIEVNPCSVAHGASGKPLTVLLMLCNRSVGRHISLKHFDGTQVETFARL